MNSVLTPESLKSVFDSVLNPLKAQKLPTKDWVDLSHSGLVEAMKHFDILGAEYTQRLYKLGFPNDGKKSMLTLKEILDVCDNIPMRCRCKSKDGVELDMRVKLTHKTEDDGYSTYRFVGTFEGKDYGGVGYSAPCALKALFRLLERDLELGFLTFETK